MLKRSLVWVVAIAACVSVVLFAVGCACSRDDGTASSEPASASASSASSSLVVSDTVAKASFASSALESAPKPDYASEPFWVLLLGLDTRENTIEADKGVYPSYSDIMILTRVDPVNHRISMLTCPRDTLTYYEHGPGKLNDAYYLWGPEGAINVVEELTGVRADYYVEGTFWTFVKFVDEMGGIDVTIPMYMYWTDIINGGQIDLYAGEQHLNGAEALVFARQRKQYPDQPDAYRQTQDRKIVEAFFNKVMGDPDSIENSVDLLLLNLGTNMQRDQLIALVTEFADHADETTIVSGSGPFEGGMNDEVELWVVERDEDTYHRLVAEIEAGGDPNNILQSIDVDW